MNVIGDKYEGQKSSEVDSPNFISYSNVFCKPNPIFI